MKGLLITAAIVVVLTAVAFAQETGSGGYGSPESRFQLGFRGGLNVNTMTGRLWGFTHLITTMYANDQNAVWTGGFSKSEVSGFAAGGFVNCRVNRLFSIQPELLIVKKGVKAGGTATVDIDGVGRVLLDMTEKVNLTYLEIPFLAKLTIPTGGKIRPGIFAGPALGINLSAKYVLDVRQSLGGDTYVIAGKPDISNNKSTDIGLVLGGDIGFPVGNAVFLLDARYTLGLNGQFGTVLGGSVPYWGPGDTPAEFPVAIFDPALEVTAVPDMKNRVVSITAGIAFNL